MANAVSHRFVVVAAAMALSGLAVGAKAETTVVVDVASGRVLSEQNASARWYPASTTKLMTTYLALKALENGDAALDTPIVMTRFAASQAPSKMGFEPGSVMRLDMALRMILVKSANDVSVAIGQALGGGSIETFVARMNTEAAALGMKDTWFINPNGLPGPGQYSSAKDLAILGTRLRRDFPAYSAIFGVEAIQAGDQLIHNTNGLIGRYAGADGMKTGYICASGFNVVASATREGRTLVAVVLGAEGPIVRDRIAAEILEKGFATDAAGLTRTVEQLPVSSGPPADISKTICSPEGQKARAEERQLDAKRGENSGSPFLGKMMRPPSVVAVGLGGAAGSATVAAGISQIAAYGIPLPRWRPDPADADDAALREEAGNAAGDDGNGTGEGADGKTSRATIAGAAVGGADLRGGVMN